MKQALQSKQKLTLRLSGYAASAGALMAIGSTANGQVVYSGLQNLELNAPSEILEMDMNSDMVTDFSFMIYATGESLSSDPYYSNYFLGYGVIYNPRTDFSNSWITKMATVRSYYSYYYGSTYKLSTAIPEGLEMGEIIDSNRFSWSNISYPYWAGALGFYYNESYRSFYGTNTSQWSAGDFLGQEKFLGVRFYIGAEQHYGWIRVSLGDLVDPVTIFDWAYEATAGVRILAGDGQGLNLPPHLLITGGHGFTANPIKTLTILTSEEITGLEVGDFVVTNGTSGNFTEVTAGWEYTVDITATAEGKVTVNIPAGVVTDLTALENIPSSASWNYDITPPYPTFPYLSDYSNYSYTYVYMEFNEPVEGLEISDFNLTNGSIYYMYEYSSGMRYELEVYTPNEGEVTLELLADAVQDMAGNPNESVSVSWIFDETPPEVIFDAGVVITPNSVNTVDITFSEPIQHLDIGYFNTTNGTNTDLQTLDAGLHYTLEVTADAPGTVIVLLPESSVYDFANNTNENTVTGWVYDLPNDIPVYEEGISIYPNPVSGNLHIELESESLIRILSMNGSVLYQQDHVLNETIDMSGFTPGVYIVQIESSDRVTQHKLIIE